MDHRMIDSESWIGRNWKWFVPVAGLLVVIVMGMIWLVLANSIRSSFPYQEGLARARASHGVTSALGSPLEDGLLVSGDVNQNESTGNASLRVSIAGPRGKGTLVIEAEEELGIWNFKSLVVELDDTDKRIDLLNEGSK